MKATVFLDAVFSDDDWEAELVHFPSRKHVQPTTVNRTIETFPRNATSQDPKANSRQTTITAERALEGDDPTKALAVSLVHINRASLFDPSVQGKVESIDFYLDLMNVSGSEGVEVHYAVVIQQADAFFQTPPARLTGLKKWKAFISEPLLANDFVRIGKPTAASPHAKPQFAQNAPPMQFGYVVHAVSRGHSLESVSRIGEWKVSVAHREDLSMSLSQTLEFKQRLDSEILERQRLERAIMEHKIKAEEELREQRLKAEEELKQLRMSLPQVITRRSDVSTSLSSSAAPPSLGGSEVTPLADAVDDKYMAIYKDAQEHLKALEARRRADLQRKKKLAEEHEQLRRTIELERHGREEAEQKWSVQYEEATRTAAEEKRKLGDELESYRKRIFHLEQELRSESKAKDQKAEELHRLRHEAAAREQELRQAADQAIVHAKLLEGNNARAVELEEIINRLSAKLVQLEDEKRELEDQMQKHVSLLSQREREWSETSEQQAREAKAAQEAADERLAAELEKWLERLNQCKATHAEQEEALRTQHDEERAQLEDALDKMNEAHERKEEAWKRTAKELKKNLKATTQKLDASNAELQCVKETLLSQLTTVEARLRAAQAEAAQRAEETEAARRDHDSLQQELRTNIERLEQELRYVQNKWQQDQAEWEQSKWQAQLESSAVARQHEEALQALRDEAKREREAALAAVRAESAAETRSAVDAVQARLDAAEASNAELAATVARLERQLRDKAEREEELVARACELETRVTDRDREVAHLTDAQRDAQRCADDARARMQAQAAVAHELEARLDEVTAERASLVKELEEEKAGRKKMAQELDALQADLATEKTLREKFARDLLAEMDARKASERQQASVIAALNDHMKKQAEAIVQLDHALKQEQADHTDLEEQLLAEIQARETAEQSCAKAEQAFRKLQELMTATAFHEDTEWELVSDATPPSS